MTDRAEPGVTPDLTYEETTRLARAISQADHVNWPSRVVAEKIAGTVRAIIEARTLDAATPLVEALRDANLTIKMMREHLRTDHPECAYEALGVLNDANRAALASGTGEPGLTRSRLAKELDNHLPRMAFLQYGQFYNDDPAFDIEAYYERVAAAIFDSLANDKGADR
jgi:hypothetical protein